MKINKMLIAVLAMLAVVLSSCKDDDPNVGIDSNMPAPAEVTYDEMNSGAKVIAIYWDAKKAISAGAMSFTVQLIRTLDGTGDVYDSMTSQTISATAALNDATTFGNLQTGKTYYVRIRANYPRSVYSDWEFVSENGSAAKIKVGKGIVPADEEDDGVTVTTKLHLVTESAVYVDWSISGFENTATDIAAAYKIELFKDAACTDLEVSWNIAAKQMCAFTTTNQVLKYGPRFIFTGLEPAKDYYFRATYNPGDLDENVSVPLKVTTAPSQFKTLPTTAAAGDIILYQDFHEIIWAGDLKRSAAGYSSKSRSSAPEYWKATGSDHSDAAQGLALCSASTEIGFFNTLKNLVPSTSFKDWGMIAEDAKTGGVLCQRPGMMKMGASSLIGWLVTPELSCLTQPATIELKFKVALYENDPTVGLVEVLDNTTVASNWFVTAGTRYKAGNFTIPSDWTEVTMNIENITSTTRIAIGAERGSLSGQCRFYLDDIQIKVLSYGELTAPDAPAKPELTATDKTITAEWGAVTRADSYTVEYKKTADNDWTTAVEKTAETSCTIEGLDFETSYDVRVKALTGDLASDPSEVAQITTLAEIQQLATPQNVTAVADYGVATLSFDPVVGATDYEVYANGATEKLVGMITDNAAKVTYKVTGLAFNTAYTFQVKAVADGVTASELSAATESTTTSTIVQVKNNVGPTTATVAWRKDLGKYEGSALKAPYDQYTIQIADINGQVMGTVDLKNTNFGAGASTLGKHAQGNLNPSRFTFGALEAATTYKVRVKKLGEDDLLYSPWCEITTEAAHVKGAKEVLYQGFDEAWYGGDVMNLAGAMKATGTNSSAPVMTWESYIGNTDVNRLADEAGTTQGSFAGAICKIESSSLYGWETPQRIALRSGYVKFGGGNEPGILITPALGENVLNATTATPCTISFKAAPYSEWSSSTDTSCEAQISITVVHADGSETVAIENFDPITNGEPFNYVWKSGSVSGVNLLSTDKLKITSKDIKSNKCRFMFDDLLVVAE